MKRNTLQLVIYLSALGVAAGVFLPLTSFPVYGEVSYYRVARLESWLVILSALSAPALILGGQRRLGVLSPLGVWIVLLFPALRDLLRVQDSNRLRQFGDDVTSAMADFSADLFLNITEFHWGGYVFLISLLVFTFASMAYQVRR